MPRPPPDVDGVLAQPDRSVPRPGPDRPDGSTGADTTSCRPGDRGVRCCRGASTPRRRRMPVRNWCNPAVPVRWTGVLIDWCAPPFGGQGDARRSADHDRLPSGVDAVRPRFESPLDEGVVHHPDGEEWLAPTTPGRTEFAHQSDQVGLGDTEFHVLTGGLLTPVHDRFGVVGKPVVPLVGGPHADLVQPACEVGGGTDVRGSV